MGDVTPFPGNCLTLAGTDPEDLDFYNDMILEDEAGAETEALDVICGRQADLLARWAWFGTELKRRTEHPLPIGLEIELNDLLDDT